MLSSYIVSFPADNVKFYRLVCYSWVKSCTDQDQHGRDHKQDEKIPTEAGSTGTTGKHHRTQRVYFIAQRVGMRYDLQPAGHDRDRVDRIAGKEERHRQHLPDAHEALARFYQAGNDERERGKTRRSHDDHDDHAQQVQRVPVHLHAKHQRQQVYDDRLRQRAHARCQRLAEDKSGSRRRTGQELVNNTQVTLPDNGDTRKDGDKEDALGQDAGSHKIQVRPSAGGDGTDMTQDLAKNQQPQGRLDGSREHIGRIVPQFTRFQPYNGERFHNKAFDGSQKTLFGELFSPAASSDTNQLVVLFGGCVLSHDNFLLILGYCR